MLATRRLLARRALTAAVLLVVSAIPPSGAASAAVTLPPQDVDVSAAVDNWPGRVVAGGLLRAVTDASAHRPVTVTAPRGTACEVLGQDGRTAEVRLLDGPECRLDLATPGTDTWAATTSTFALQVEPRRVVRTQGEDRVATSITLSRRSDVTPHLTPGATR